MQNKYRELVANEIIYALDILHIYHENFGNSQGWVNIICPFHKDSSTGNSSINLYSGVIHCFNCKKKKHVLKLVQEQLNISYKEAFEKVTNNIVNSVKQVNDLSFLSKNKLEEICKPKSNKTNFNYIDGKQLESFNPKDYYYTRVREFTKDFCNQFNIKKCIEGYYKDYFIVPIIDSEQKIYTFEARKLSQRELMKAAGINDFVLKEVIDTNMLKIKDGKVFSKTDNNFVEYGDEFLFFLKKKVLYPSNSMIHETLFNIDNLNYNEDLYISEGIGSIPKIFNNITTNVTCTFGSEITEKQIELLNRFKNRKIIIPDNDQASLIMIESLNVQIKNLYVIDIRSEDTSRNFIADINNAEIKKASKYLTCPRKEIPFLQVRDEFSS